MEHDITQWVHLVQNSVCCCTRIIAGVSFQRSKAFIEEVEENEKKKALQAARGPVSLATVMKEKLANNRTDVVFLHIGVLMEDEVFVSL